MSQENVDIVTQAVTILQEGDPREVFALGLAAADARWQGAREFDSRTYVGAEGFAEFMRTWTEDFHDWTIQMTDVRDVGDRVLVFARQRAVGKGSGVRVEMDFAMLFTLRDALISDTRAFLNRAEALEAAGLRD